MTDFYVACMEREEQIIQETREQLMGYQVEVKHRDGVYRHVYCCKPGQGKICDFHVVTWPNHATITGDWCKSYILGWEYDMFSSFLSTKEPCVRYWAEKLRNPVRLKTTEFEFVKLYLFDWLDYWADEDMDAETLDRCKYALEQWIDIDDPLLIDHLSNWCFSYQDKNSGRIFKPEPFYNFTYEDADWDVWTEDWIRVCELLRWTACKVTEMEATHGC